MGERFTRLEQEAWGGFLATFGRIDRLVGGDLEEHSRITHVEFEALLRLSWESEHRLRIQDLAARSILTRSGVSRVVERLERAGLVQREEAPEDRRGAYARLTDAGAERLRAAMPPHVRFVRAKFLRHFGDQELEQMAGFWKRLEGGRLET
jgi:DNA-binding MarR family transcriptional regulator